MIYLIIFLPERRGEKRFYFYRLNYHPPNQDHYLNGSDKQVDGEHSGEEKPKEKQVSKIPGFLKETLVGVS